MPTRWRVAGAAHLCCRPASLAMAIARCNLPLPIAHTIASAAPPPRGRAGAEATLDCRVVVITTGRARVDGPRALAEWLSSVQYHSCSQTVRSGCSGLPSKRGAKLQHTNERQTRSQIPRCCPQSDQNVRNARKRAGHAWYSPGAFASTLGRSGRGCWAIPCQICVD